MSTSKKTSSSQKPFKRTAYFISGLHPFGFEHFWPILKKGAQQHARLYPRKIDINQTGDWDGNPEVILRAKEKGARDTITTYRYMKWNDLVIERMKEPYIIAFFGMLFIFIKGIFNGEVRKLYKLSRGFGNGMVYVNIPIFIILGVTFFSAIYFYSSLGLLSVLMVGLGLIGAITLTKSFEKFFHIKHYYHLFKIRFDWNAGKEKSLEKRIDKFSNQLAQALLTDDTDELLIIGHSYGTLLAVDALAKALDKIKGKKIKPKKVGLITVGAIHHSIAICKSAHSYRKSLGTVGGDERIYWLEPFSPQDGGNFPKCNPVTDFTDVSPAYGPHQKSIKYKELVTPKTYKKNKHNFWRMHFQYLYEGEIPGDYSFFRMLCSDHPLEKNYGYREKLQKKTSKEKK